MKEMVFALGYKKVLAALEAEGATSSSVSVKLVLKLVGTANSGKSDSTTSTNVAQSTKVPSMQHAIELANNVAATCDKIVAVRALWDHLHVHPEIDASACVKHLSFPHRRYIADRLASLSSTIAGNDVVKADEINENFLTNQQQFSSSIGSTGSSSSGKSKRRKNNGSSEKKVNNKSPVSPVENDKTALRTRSSSIDNLLPTPPSTKARKSSLKKASPSKIAEPPAAPSAQTQATGVDSDLIARFARLKQQANK
jgi:hypothetical protein